MAMGGGRGGTGTGHARPWVGTVVKAARTAECAQACFKWMANRISDTWAGRNRLI